MRRLWVIVAILLVAVMPLAGCAEEAEEGEQSFKLGMIAHLSGYLADDGKRQRDGFILAVEQINKNGGINGHPLEAIVYDDQTSPSRSVLTAKKLINEDRVVAIAYGGVEGPAYSVMPIVEEAGVPLTMTTGSTEIMMDLPKWSFTLIPTAALPVATFYEFCKREGFTRIAMLAVSTSFGLSGIEVVRATASDVGLDFVAIEQYGPIDVDMLPQLAKIKAANPQILYIHGVEMAGVIAAGQAKDMKLGVPIFVIAPMIEPKFLEVRPEALEGIFSVGPKIPFWQDLPDDDPQLPVITAIKAGMKEKYGREKVYTAETQGYDNALLLAEALRIANPDPANIKEARTKIRNALENVELAGSFLTYKYSPDYHGGMAFNTRGVVVTVENGALVRIDWQSQKALKDYIDVYVSKLK